ncbi:hypothetical protein C8F04DRAFT_1252851 [Mycena alexandri]|uniref:DUF6533 domain-containing protein n=1 Tax=Mycena alexandri TaxID=1745969 RepID=A0AAD6T811_9AGAR|nr:hypothetical protein C8F04DRAFT_1252851 [Mycena alexandri]
MADAVVAQQLVITNYVHLIGITILYYDHFITLGPEIHLLWRRRISLSAYWLYVNRYFGFFSGIPVATLPFLTVSDKICTRFSIFRELVLVITQPIASKFAASWEGLFIFNTVIFVMTVYNTYTTRRQMALLNANNDGEQDHSPPPNDLHHLMMRDGAMYFGIMALANLANIATYYFSGPVVPGSLAIFANCISITMISRMMLNLHVYAMNTGIMSESPPGPADAQNIRNAPPALWRLPIILTDPDFTSQRSTSNSRRTTSSAAIVEDERR